MLSISLKKLALSCPYILVFLWDYSGIYTFPPRLKKLHSAYFKLVKFCIKNK